MHPKAIGDRTTLAAMLALEQAGYRVSVPFGENSRYDLIIDDGACLARVQCKTGRLRNGAVQFPACSTYAHHPNPKVPQRDYPGQIEYFAVYCLETTCVYLVPIEHVDATSRAMLRVDPARNGQRRRIRPSSRYRIGTVALGS
jgi:PD-(D/E)XK endonuclease